MDSNKAGCFLTVFLVVLIISGLGFFTFPDISDKTLEMFALPVVIIIIIVALVAAYTFSRDEFD